MKTIQMMRSRDVDELCYFRLNVETGVGDAGIAEWQKLADISTGTRRYLAEDYVQEMIAEAARRLEGIYLQIRGRPVYVSSTQYYLNQWKSAANVEAVVGV